VKTAELPVETKASSDSTKAWSTGCARFGTAAIADIDAAKEGVKYSGWETSLGPVGSAIGLFFREACEECCSKTYA